MSDELRNCRNGKRILKKRVAELERQIEELGKALRPLRDFRGELGEIHSCSDADEAVLALRRLDAATPSERRDIESKDRPTHIWTGDKAVPLDD